MKGRIVWVFWLVVVLAALTATASYAWLAMNVSTGVRGIEVELLSDSLFLEISADRDTGYDTSVSFGRATYSLRNNNDDDDGISFVTYKRIAQTGALRITTVPIFSGEYDGTGRYFKAVRSDITEADDTFIDVTDTLTVGQSLAGLFTVNRGLWFPVSDSAYYDYYYEHVRDNGTVDYVCIGKIPKGENLAGRLIWGYSKSDDLNDPQEKNIINVVSVDVPPEGYCLSERVYIRCSDETVDAKNLRISDIRIDGREHYLTKAIRIMFVATSGNGETVTRFYSHREPENFYSFNSFLFSDVMGDGKEIITVDMYVFFDGTDEDAYVQDGIITKNDITVKFEIDDHYYN